ncbi:glucuronyltransferase I [Oratosquilla oratoria]|uniref:glucuronyltransferase I n=1 Tax=Oratosquilla oratoria TaxID=337810 RepID=UPI003F765D05
MAKRTTGVIAHMISTYYIYKRRLKKIGYVLIIASLVSFILYGYYGLYNQKGSEASYYDLPSEGLRELLRLRREVIQLKAVLNKYNVPLQEYKGTVWPTIYVITPTYSRPHQKAELSRLKHVFIQVPSLHWIVVEDAREKSELVQQFLAKSSLEYTHLNIPTPPEWKLRQNDPSWKKPRGVLQRNQGIQWLRDHQPSSALGGVVYFADDDNTYTPELFHEMRSTKIASVWPVGLVGGVMVERPQVVNGKVVGWLVGWRADRPFAVDMASFAINLRLLQAHPTAQFSLDSQRGFLESDFLQELITMDQLEPKADMCTKVLVWHTRTEKPNLKEEVKMLKKGRGTNEGIEV